MQKMKVFIFAVLLSFFFGSSLATYQQQGFTMFQENGSTVIFSCEKQCFILLGGVGTNEMISLQGSTQGGGQLGYGFLVGDKVYPGEMIGGEASFNKTFAFSQVQLFSQLPKEQTQMVILVNGNLQSSGLTIDYGKLFFSEKLQLGWNDLWMNEPIRPYSINLRYGVKILGTPLLQYFYWFFVIGAIIIVFGIKRKEAKFYYLLIFGIVLILLFSLRNLRNRTDWTMTGLRTYTNAPELQKTLFDLGDYPVFVAKIRKTLDLDNQFGKTTCTFYFDTLQDWPYKSHVDSVYLKPCESAPDRESADYIVFYKKAVAPEFASQEILLERNGSFLVHNKK